MGESRISAEAACSLDSTQRLEQKTTSGGNLQAPHKSGWQAAIIKQFSLHLNASPPSLISIAYIRIFFLVINKVCCSTDLLSTLF